MSRRPSTALRRLLLPLAGLGLAWFAPACDTPPGAGEPGAQERATAVVEQGDLVIAVSATGTVEPEAEVEVKSKASGEIVEFPYRAGDVVSSGALLCRLDPADEERNVERGRIELAAAEARLAASRAALRVAEADRAQALRDASAAEGEAAARLDEARARAERDERLLRQGVVSAEEAEAGRARLAEARAAAERASASAERARSRDDDVERARQEVQRAHADQQAAQIALEEVRKRLEETRIPSPIDGVVTETLVEAGQVISSAISNVGGGTTLLKIADLSRLYVLVPVDEVDIGRVRLGQPVRIRPDAFPDRTLSGEVVQIAPVGKEEQSVVLFDVRASAEGEGALLLRPGMTADVEMEVARSEATLWVPRDALGPSGDTLLVAGAEGRDEERPVTTGLRDGHRVEILSGAAAGEVVVLRGPGAPSAWRKESSPAPSRAGGTAGFLLRLRR